MWGVKGAGDASGGGARGAGDAFGRGACGCCLCCAAGRRAGKRHGGRSTDVRRWSQGRQGSVQRAAAFQAPPEEPNQGIRLSCRRQAQRPRHPDPGKGGAASQCISSPENSTTSTRPLSMSLRTASTSRVWPSICRPGAGRQARAATRPSTQRRQAGAAWLRFLRFDLAKGLVECRAPAARPAASLASQLGLGPHLQLVRSLASLDQLKVQQLQRGQEGSEDEGLGPTRSTGRHAACAAADVGAASGGLSRCGPQAPTPLQRNSIQQPGPASGATRSPHPPPPPPPPCSPLPRCPWTLPPP